jgi:hypothetical protein
VGGGYYYQPLNFDLWQDYSVVMRTGEWEIANPAGFRISSKSASHCFWWKPFQSKIKGDGFLVSEIKYVFRELYNYFFHRGLIVGNPPDFHNRLGKLQILEIATRFFRTPQSVVGWNLPEQFRNSDAREIVAKSLSSEFTSDGRALYTSLVEYQSIDRSCPWFLQTKINAANDVTIVVCGDEFYAYTRSREGLQGLDWRRTIGNENHPERAWQARPLSAAEQKSVRGLCQLLRVRWGRFDFLEDEKGLVFLEFNANGQWAFLDCYGNNGLTEAVVSYLLKSPAPAPPLLAEETKIDEAKALTWL